MQIQNNKIHYLTTQEADLSLDTVAQMLNRILQLY